MLYPNPQIYHHIKTIFVHVPKAAGTSIERRLRQSDKDVVGGHTTALAYRRKYPEEFATYFKFAVVRDPIDRFLSAYCYLKQMPIHAALNNQIVHECESIARFVDRIEATPAILTSIVHLIPQYRFVCDSAGKVLVDTVFKFESLDAAWLAICARTGIKNVPLPKANASSRLLAGDYPADRVRRLLSEEYAIDFATFDYSAIR